MNDPSTKHQIAATQQLVGYMLCMNAKGNRKSSNSAMQKTHDAKKTSPVPHAK